MKAKTWKGKGHDKTRAARAVYTNLPVINVKLLNNLMKLPATAMEAELSLSHTYEYKKYCFSPHCHSGIGHAAAIAPARPAVLLQTQTPSRCH